MRPTETYGVSARRVEDPTARRTLVSDARYLTLVCRLAALFSAGSVVSASRGIALIVRVAMKLTPYSERLLNNV